MIRPVPAIALAAAFCLMASVAHAADKRTIADGAGRRVEVPARIERAGRPVQICVPTLRTGAA